MTDEEILALLILEGAKTKVSSISDNHIVIEHPDFVYKELDVTAGANLQEAWRRYNQKRNGEFVEDVSECALKGAYINAMRYAKEHPEFAV